MDRRLAWQTHGMGFHRSSLYIGLYATKSRIKAFKFYSTHIPTGRFTSRRNIEVLFMPLVMLVAGSRAMPSVSRSTPVTPLHTHTHTHARLLVLLAEPQATSVQWEVNNLVLCGSRREGFLHRFVFVLHTLKVCVRIALWFMNALTVFCHPNTFHIMRTARCRSCVHEGSSSINGVTRPFPLSVHTSLTIHCHPNTFHITRMARCRNSVHEGSSSTSGMTRPFPFYFSVHISLTIYCHPNTFHITWMARCRSSGGWGYCEWT